MAVSSTTGGLRTGVCLSTDRPQNPYNGQVIYETDTNRTLVWDNSAWVVMVDPALLSYSGTGATVTADAMTVGGENVTPYTGRKNLIINGNFDVWQRGAGPFTGGADYSADRWVMSSSGATVSVTQQSFTDGQTDVPGNPRYFLRLDVTTGNDNCRIIQRIEDVRTCSNETVTVSFWAKGTARSFDVKFRQQFDGSTEVYTDLGSYTPSASWQKFSFTTTLPSVSGKTIGANSYLGLALFWQNDASTSAYTCDIAQVQVERGSKATPFENRSYGEELALCQRYYTRFSRDVGFQPVGGAGIVRTATDCSRVTVDLPTTMRATGNSSNIEYSDMIIWDGNLVQSISSFALVQVFQNKVSLDCTASGMTTGNPGVLLTNNASGAYFAVSMEL